MMNINDKNAPIGVFDSGLGGLTALKRLQKDLPSEDLLYFGDTARVPYGGRDKQTLLHFAKTDIALLQSYGVKAVLVACGTVSSVILEEIKQNYEIPLVGVVESAAEAAAKATHNGTIGIWGTAASIGSGAYAKRLAERGYENTVAVACPKLVPLIEGGHTAADDAEARAAVREYLAPVLKSGADTLILGCTHYPLLADVIRAEAGEGLTLIDSGAESIATLHTALKERGLLQESGAGTSRFLVSGDPLEFARGGGRFLNQELFGKVEQADAEAFGE